MAQLTVDYFLPALMSLLDDRKVKHVGKYSSVSWGPVFFADSFFLDTYHKLETMAF